MSITRKNFIKKICMGGACLCGFTSLAGKNNSPEISSSTQEESPMEKFYRNWITEMLDNLNDDLSEDSVRSIIKSASAAHYEYNRMDDMLAPYVGNVSAFNSFLEKEWGWKVSYVNDGKVMIIDEQKPFCVCPLIAGETKKYPALCYCSEGFAEKMFSEVIGKPVTASITSSIQRGDSKCMYRIEME